MNTRRTSSLFSAIVVLTTLSLCVVGCVPATVTAIHTSLHVSSIPSDDHTVPDECTSVIVTGSAAKDGRAILMKNRDTAEIQNVPVYNPATDNTFAFVAVNSMWMGINEKGLAVMNTAMPSLSDSPDAGSYNGILNRKILELCNSVADVDVKLKTTDSPLLPDPSMPELSVATCVGVIDQFGAGAFFEIGDEGVFSEYVVDGYQSRANHPRVYPGLASGPSGRDQYALDALEAIMTENGVISWQDVAQEVSRCVREKEYGSTDFSIAGEVCNDNTASAMVAVSGDSRYEGRLNVMWGEYGLVPMVGVFLPSLVYAGAVPSVMDEMVNYTLAKQEYACPHVLGVYSPTRVREIQHYSFAAEDYAFEQYDRLVNLVPLGLSDTRLKNTLCDFVRLSVTVAADMYVNETAILPSYAVPFTIDETPSMTVNVTTTTGASTSSTTSTSSASGQESPTLHGFVMLASGFASGILAVLVSFWLVRSIRRR